MSIEQIKLGTQGAVVSREGLGCMGMSEHYGERNDEESTSTLLRALDLGVTFFDTSDAYGPEDNEELVGRVLRPHRDKVFLATKFGFTRTKAEPEKPGVSGKPEFVRQRCEASLRRLGVDHIDLYYQHRVAADTPIEETVGAMAELVRQGKVRFLGLSEANADTIRRAHRVHPITALQSEYSLWTREPEAEILPTLHELGIGFVPYSPLGRGFLTGTITKDTNLGASDMRKFRYPRLSAENIDKNQFLVDRVRALADRKGVKPGQLALAWVFSKGSNFAPIPGTKRRHYLEENVAALDIRLTPAEIAGIEAAVPVSDVAGDRYSAGAMQLLDR